MLNTSKYDTLPVTYSVIINYYKTEKKIIYVSIMREIYIFVFACSCNGLSLQGVVITCRL